MMRTITELGPREAEFLATMAGSGKEVFTSEQAVVFWRGRQQANNALARLESKGWVERLERGKYLIIPLAAGPERTWSEDPLAIGTFLAPEGAAAYWTAIKHWGWTTQLTNTTFFITPRRRFSPRATVMGTAYHFVTLKPERVFGIAEEWSGSLRVRVTNRERTVLDMMDRTDLCGGVAEVASALQAGWPELDLERLTGYVVRFGGGTVPKRLGFLSEWLQLSGVEPWIPRWQGLVGAGFTSLERGGPSTGRLLRRWNLRINESGFDAKAGQR